MRTLRTSAQKALELSRRGRGKPGFQQTGLNTWAWDVAGQCEKRTHIAVRGRPTRNVEAGRIHPLGYRLVLTEKEKQSGVPIHGELAVRCRKCAACLRYKRAQWTTRALAELQYCRLTGRRVWFGTLTLHPDRHMEFEAQAARRCRQNSDDWYSRPADDRFRRYVREIYPEVQLWLKRVRKQSRAGLRYIIVAEKHSLKLAGYAHFHVLLFEHSGQVRKGRHLEGQWKLGVSHWRLVPDDEEHPERKVAAYVCKYLTKDGASFIRASGRLTEAHGREKAEQRPGNYARAVSLDETFALSFPDEPGEEGTSSAANEVEASTRA